MILTASIQLRDKMFNRDFKPIMNQTSALFSSSYLDFQSSHSLPPVAAPLNPICGHEQPRGRRHQCARNKPSSPELPDSIHLLGVKVMHTAVTGGSHCIPSDPSRDINFAWARGPRSEFLSLPHFLPTTPPLFRTVVGHRHKHECVSQPGAARERSPLHRRWQIIPQLGMPWPSLACYPAQAHSCEQVFTSFITPQCCSVKCFL